jgi:hypothetical protein
MSQKRDMGRSVSRRLKYEKALTLSKRFVIFGLILR